MVDSLFCAAFRNVDRFSRDLLIHAATLFAIAMTGATLALRPGYVAVDVTLDAVPSGRGQLAGRLEPGHYNLDTQAYCTPDGNTCRLQFEWRRRKFMPLFARDHRLVLFWRDDSTPTGVGEVNVRAPSGKSIPIRCGPAGCVVAR